MYNINNISLKNILYRKLFKNLKLTLFLFEYKIFNFHNNLEKGHAIFFESNSIDYKR